MKVTITAKIKINPTPEQINLLQDTLKSYSIGCNFVSGIVFQSKQLRQGLLQETAQLKDNEVKQVVGIDFGVNFIATSYDSQDKATFFDGREAKHTRSKYKQLRRHLQRLKTPCARRKLKSIGQRENRWMTDVNHTVSKALAERYGAHTLFVIEDLTGIRKATEKVRLNNRYETVSWAFYQLRQMLEYKATLAQSKVIAVNPQYTSQTCPKCGHTQKANRNKQKHLFCCKNCRYTSNDDRIGTINLQ